MKKAHSTVTVLLATLVASWALFATGCSDEDFVVSVDRPLRVVYLSPADGTQGVMLQTPVTAVFSEAVVEATVTDPANFYVENITDPENTSLVEGTIAYDAGTKSAVFTPANPFGYSSVYVVHLTKGITKEDTSNSFGGELAIEVTAQFRTIDPDVLSVVYTHPAAGAWKVPVAQPVRIVFSHTVDTASVVYGESFMVEDITDSENPVLVSPAETDGIVWNEEHTILTYTPAVPYGYSRLLAFTLTDAVKSVEATEAGGHLASDISIPFATLDPPALALIVAQPDANESGILRETAPNSGEATPFVLTFSEGVNQTLIDTNADGLLDENDTGAIVITDISEDLDEPRIVPCSIEWLDMEGAPAVDAPPADDGTDLYLVGRDAVIRLTPTELLDYSRKLRITVAGDSDPAQHPLDGIVLSDRATDRGGQLPATVQYTFRMQDPPPLALVQATPSAAPEGDTLNVPRETEPGSGAPSSLIFTFSEGVNQALIDINGDGLLNAEDDGSAFAVMDITESNDASAAIPGTLTWLDAEGQPATDIPPGTDLIGSDITLVFTPSEILNYSTLVRVTLTGDDGTTHPLEGVFASDRATFRGGQLPATVEYTFRMQDPPPLTLVQATPSAAPEGDTLNVPRETEPGSGAPSSLIFTFSEGIDQALIDINGDGLLNAEDNGSAFAVMDITESNDAPAAIPGTLTWLDAEGQPATDIPPGTDLVGSDITLVFTPSDILNYSTLVRVTLTGDGGTTHPLEGVFASDRATFRGGQLPATVEYTFRMQDPPPLTLVQATPSAAPEGDTLNVPRETEPGSGAPSALIFTFSEGVNQALIDINGDGLLNAEDTGSAFAVIDITESNDAPAAIPGTLTWLDAEGQPAADIPPGTDLIGSDITLVFTPSEILNYSTLVRVTLTGDDGTVHPLTGVFASDRATFRGGQLPATVEYTFRMQDPPPLGVESVVSGSDVYPLSRLVNNAPESLVITFTEGVDRAAGDDFAAAGLILVEDVTGLANPLTDAANSAIAGTFVWNAVDTPPDSTLVGDDNIVTFTPAEPLGYGTKLRITLVGEAAPSLEGIHSDRATFRGGQLPETKTYIFDIETIPDFSVVSTVPADGAMDVAIDTPITITFSEGIDCDTVDLTPVNGSLLAVFAATDPEAPQTPVEADITPACVDDATQLILIPEPDIKYSRDIVLTLTESIASLRARDINPLYDPLQGHLRGGYAMAYSTVDPPALSVVSIKGAADSSVLQRDLDGNAGTLDPEAIVIAFSEGVRRDFNGDGLVDAADEAALYDYIVVDDITGLSPAELDAGLTNGVIAGTFAWNAPSGLWLDEDRRIGSDNQVVFTPDTWWQWGTVVRVRLAGAVNAAGAANALYLESDRATARGGQLPADVYARFAVDVLPDLYVAAALPGDTAIGIPIDSEIVITFSEGVSCDSILTGMSVAFAGSDPEAPGAAVDGAFDCTDGLETVTFTPAAPVKYSRDVVVTMTSDILSWRAASDPANPGADPLQGHLRDGYTIAYSTVDPPALGLIAIETTSGNLSMQLGDGIIMTFSEGVDQTTATLGTGIIIEDVTGLANPLTDPALGEITGSLQWNAADAPAGADLVGDDNSAMFTPEVPFLYGTKVRITLRGSGDAASAMLASDRATDRGGNLPMDIVMLLDVIRLPELYVVSTVPGHEARTVAYTTDTITVTFSAAPDCAGINAGTIEVRWDDGVFADDPIDTTGEAIAGAWACTAGNPTVTFTAANPFGWGRDILVYLSSDVRDARLAVSAVNPADDTQGYLVPEYRFGFGTEHMTLVQILATNAGGSISFARDRNIRIVFDREVDCATVNGSTLYINRGPVADLSAALPATIVCAAASSDTVELDPVDDTASPLCDGTALCYDTDYTFAVVGGAPGVCVPGKDPSDPSNDGCVLAPEAVFSFKTELVPELTAELFPEHNTIGIAAAVEPRVTFSKAINTATVENEPGPSATYPAADGVTPNICLIEGQNRTDCAGPDVVALDAVTPYSFTAGDTVVTLNTASDLDPDTWYTLVVSRDIEDITGKRLATFYSSSFKTTPGGLLADVTVLNLGDLNNLQVRARFTQDVNVDTVNNATFLLTFVTEFGDTMIVPAGVMLDNWQGGGTCDPANTGDVNCDMALLYPNLLSLFTCGALSAEYSAGDGSINAGASLFHSDSYGFTAADIGKYVYIQAPGVLTDNGSFRISAVAGGDAVVEDGLLIDASNLQWALTLTPNALPYNTQFTAHLSAVIQSSDGTLNVPPTAGYGDYRLDFVTGTDLLLDRIEYANDVVGPTSVGQADEVPVDTSLYVRFTRPVDPASVNADTLVLSDARGLDGNVSAGSQEFYTDRIGMFVAGRDEGKFITLYDPAGSFAILSVIDDHTVTLNVPGGFVADAGGLQWMRSWDGTSMAAISVEPDGMTAVYTPLMNLNHHADYSGYNAVVAPGSAVVTVNPNLTNFRFRRDRDLGRKLIVTGSALGNNAYRTIIAVNETTNAVTLNGTVFTSTETGLSWHIQDEDDYHSLILKGRSGSNPVTYIRDADGVPFADAVRVSFFTSPETTVVFTPIENDNPQVLQNASAIFSRAVLYETLVDDNLYLEQNGEKIGTLSSYNVTRPETITLMPIPAMEPGLPALIIATAGVRDFRGNPVVPRVHNLGLVQSAPSTSALTPNEAPAISPANGAAIAGMPTFTLTWTQDGNNDRNTMLPGSINEESVDLVQIEDGANDGIAVAGSDVLTIVSGGPFVAGRDEGRFIEVTGSLAGNDGRRRILAVLNGSEVRLNTPFAGDETTLAWELLSKPPLEIVYIPRGLNGDYAEIRPTEPLHQGAPVRLIVDNSKIANLYTLSFNSQVTGFYTLEAVPPTLNSNAIIGKTLGDPLHVAVDGRNDVLPDTELVAVLSEAVDPASVTDATVLLTDGFGTVTPGFVNTEDNMVVFMPAGPMKWFNNPYTLTVTAAVTDMAGNPLGSDVSATFDIEGVAPQFVDITPADGTPAVSTGATVSLRFSESLDPATVYGSMEGRDGSLRITRDVPVACNADNDPEVYGCIAFSGDNTMVTFKPYAPGGFMDETVFTVLLADSVADVAGNTLLDGAETFGFDTMIGDLGAPAPVCATLPVIPLDNQIVLYVNMPLDPATINADTVFVFNTDTGEVVPGTFALESTNTVIRFTTTLPILLPGSYGVVVTTDVTSGGMPLNEPWQLFFDVI